MSSGLVCKTITNAIKPEAPDIELLDVGQQYLAKLINASKCNELSPTSRLPTEIIEKIFKLIQGEERVDEGPGDYRSWGSIERKEWNWIVVTHVCRSWRDIAIGYQVLWTDIQTGLHVDPIQTQTFLERSGASQLVVRHYLPGKAPRATSTACLQLALQQLHRIRELSIWGISDEEGVRIQDQLSNPALALQTFAFQLPSLYDSNTLFRGRAPKLEKLTVRFHSQYWSQIPIMHGLKSLKLSNANRSPSLTEILDILRGNPGLDYIFLHAALEDMNIEPTVPATNPIRLSSLREIIIGHIDYKLLSHLLCNIAITNDAHWDITCENFPVYRSPNIIPIVLNRDTPCNSIHLTMEATFMRLETDPGDQIEQRQKGLPVNTCLEYNWDSFPEGPPYVRVHDVFHVAATIVENRFWSYASEIDFEIYPAFFDGPLSDLNAAVWMGLLGLLPRLRIVRVHCLHPRPNDLTTMKVSHIGLLNALAQKVTRDNGQTEYILPQLSELCLHGLDPDFIPELLECFALRAEYGFRLRRLEIYNGFGLTESDISKLRQAKVADEVISTVDDEFEIDVEDFQMVYRDGLS